MFELILLKTKYRDMYKFKKITVLVYNTVVTMVTHKR